MSDSQVRLKLEATLDSIVRLVREHRPRVQAISAQNRPGDEIESQIFETEHLSHGAIELIDMSAVRVGEELHEIGVGVLECHGVALQGRAFRVVTQTSVDAHRIHGIPVDDEALAARMLRDVPWLVVPADLDLFEAVVVRKLAFFVIDRAP